MALEVESSFMRFLRNKNVGDETIAILAKESIVDKDTFKLLDAQHMDYGVDIESVLCRLCCRGKLIVPVNLPR